MFMSLYWVYSYLDCVSSNIVLIYYICDIEFSIVLLSLFYIKFKKLLENLYSNKYVVPCSILKYLMNHDIIIIKYYKKYLTDNRFKIVWMQNLVWRLI